MEKAKNFDEFARGIADGIGMGCRVRYDSGSLQYGEMLQLHLDEYGDYVDMEELPENIGDELKDWEIDEVKYLRAILELPNEIEPPRSRTQFDWMVDFANAHSKGPRFVKDVQWAIDSRHPFSAFKNVMADYELLNDWYQYRDECCLDYVRQELSRNYRGLSSAQ